MTNNELMDFLSRVPNDEMILDARYIYAMQYGSLLFWFNTVTFSLLNREKGYKLQVTTADHRVIGPLTGV